MSCDINDPDNLSEYDSTFSKISALCIKNDVQNLCVLYDMNTDLSRFHSWHTQSLLTFIENEDLFITLNHSCAYIWYSYCNTYTSAFAIIEHIFVSQRLSSYIHKYHSINDKFDNQSDHVLIVIIIIIIIIIIIFIRNQSYILVKHDNTINKINLCIDDL